jgi:hypothetical protein
VHTWEKASARQPGGDGMCVDLQSARLLLSHASATWSQPAGSSAYGKMSRTS